MTTSINNRPLLEESETSENEEDFLDNSYTDTPGTSKNTVRTDSQAELVRFSQSVPADKFNFSYIIFYLLGVTTVLPWNFFLTAEEVSFPMLSIQGAVQEIQCTCTGQQCPPYGCS